MPQTFGSPSGPLRHIALRGIEDILKVVEVPLAIVPTVGPASLSFSLHGL